jgi:hypothetical protein
MLHHTNGSPATHTIRSDGLVSDLSSLRPQFTSIASYAGRYINPLTAFPDVAATLQLHEREEWLGRLYIKASLGADADKRYACTQALDKYVQHMSMLAHLEEDARFFATLERKHTALSHFTEYELFPRIKQGPETPDLSRLTGPKEMIIAMQSLILSPYLTGLAERDDTVAEVFAAYTAYATTSNIRMGRSARRALIHGTFKDVHDLRHEGTLEGKTHWTLLPPSSDESGQRSTRVDTSVGCGGFTNADLVRLNELTSAEVTRHGISGVRIQGDGQSGMVLHVVDRSRR